MTKRSLYFCCLNWLFGLLASLPSVSAQEIVTLATRPGITQAYFLASVPKSTQAIALLFAGSGGFIKLRREGEQISLVTTIFSCAADANSSTDR